IHDQAAPFALDALDPDERAAFETHLAGCERCRRELAELEEVVGALAYVNDGPAPPPALRERIVAAARAEGPSHVVALRPARRWLVPAAAALAVAAAAAIAIGVWQGVDSGGGGGERLAWSLDVGPAHTGRLTVSGLPSAPGGKVYEAWVIVGNKP